MARSSALFLVVITETLELRDDLVVEAGGSFDDLLDNLTSTGVLIG